MKISPPVTVQQIADLLEGTVVGDPKALVTGLNEIHRAENGDLIFVDHPKYYDAVTKSKATTIIIDQEVDCPASKNLIISKDPFGDYNKLISTYYQQDLSDKAISKTATIGNNTIIRANVVIGDQVVIGDNCVIHPNVSIGAHCIIKDNVIIHANTVIGGDAFYYKRREHGHDKLLSCGNVIIEENVEIGALCSIDRGASASTIIGAGSKLDNQVHIGHDSRIGKNCLFAAQVGIAGMVEIKDNVTLWGQVGVASNLTIGEEVVILGQSGIGKSLDANKTYFGSPVSEARDKMRELVLIKKIPEIIERLS